MPSNPRGHSAAERLNHALRVVVLQRSLASERPPQRGLCSAVRYLVLDLIVVVNASHDEVMLGVDLLGRRRLSGQRWWDPGLLSKSPITQRRASRLP